MLREFAGGSPYKRRMGKLWVFVLLAVNALTFVVYGYDKWCAKKGWRRISERNLLTLAFLCGWVGAWAAMSVFRHKTRKASFRWRLVLLTVLNPCWLLLWFAAQQ